MRTLVLIDVNNLYYCTKKKFGRKINYTEFYKNLQKINIFGSRNLDSKGLGSGTNIVKTIAYSTQEDCINFIKVLNSLGIDTKFYADTFIGEIFLDCVRYSDKIDSVIICSSNPDFYHLLAWLNEKLINTLIYSCGIPKILKHNFIELDESVLEPKILETKILEPKILETKGV
jgi:uncharacterized LabA/DUF88 family protein